MNKKRKPKGLDRGSPKGWIEEAQKGWIENAKALRELAKATEQRQRPKERNAQAQSKKGVRGTKS